jgi:hypothetical protein
MPLQLETLSRRFTGGMLDARFSEKRMVKVIGFVGGPYDLQRRLACAACTAQ